MKSFTFNDVRKPWLLALKGRTKPPFASINRNLLNIPGRAGSFLQTSQTQSLVINQPIGFMAEDDQEALNLTDELAEWLVTDEPVALTFDDEPDRVYYAIVQNTIDDFERFAQFREGTIQFVCPDPYAYSIEETTQKVEHLEHLTNDGTAETYPIFEIQLEQPVTQLEIKNTTLKDRQGVSPSILLGRPARIDDTQYTREELVFHDSMQSTSTWTTAAEVDNGRIAGEMGVNEDGFYPALFGGAIRPYNWQGPSLIKGLGASLQDFKADIYVKNFNAAEETGMLDIYLRDANSRVIGKIGFGDAWAGKEENFGHAQVGDYVSGHRLNAQAAHQNGWNDFDGIIRISREDNVWRFYFAKIQADGTHVWVKSTLRYTDNARAYMAPITDVQVAFRLWPITERTDIAVKEIKIYRINQPESISGNTGKVPYIGAAGDVITVDTKKSSIRLNGEPADYLADLSSQMFPLAKGHNQMAIFPFFSFTAKAKFRETYL